MFNFVQMLFIPRPPAVRLKNTVLHFCFLAGFIEPSQSSFALSWNLLPLHFCFVFICCALLKIKPRTPYMPVRAAPEAPSPVQAFTRLPKTASPFHCSCISFLSGGSTGMRCQSQLMSFCLFFFIWPTLMIWGQWQSSCLRMHEALSSNPRTDKIVSPGT